jgi:hypothetical protein
MSKESVDVLADLLQVLANPARLTLLEKLQVPRTIGELSVAPSREDVGLSADRAMSRQSVERHLDILAGAGLVSWTEAPTPGRAAKAYVLNHARMFAVVEELRGLSRLRAKVVNPEATTDLREASPVDPESVAGPRLVMLRGVPEGRIFSLKSAAGTTVGRGETADVRLDHDPFISSMHCLVTVGPAGTTVSDSGESRNGTFVNGRRLLRDEPARLTRGNLLEMGRSLFLYLD